MTHVITVSTTVQRDNLITNIRKGFKDREHEQPNVEVIQDRQNRILVYHKTAPDIRTLIKTILVVVIQVHINLEPLKEIYDDIILFDLNEVFKAIDCYKDKLNKIMNTTSRRRNNNAKFRGLLDSLMEDRYEK